MATKVTMFEAKDGSLHKTPALADARNVELRLKPLIEGFVNGLSMEAPGLGRDDRDNFVIHLDELPTFLLAHSEPLRKALNDALVIKRPRKAKSEKPAQKPAPEQPAGGASLDDELNQLGS